MKEAGISNELFIKCFELDQKMFRERIKELEHMNRLYTLVYIIAVWLLFMAFWTVVLK